MSVLIKSKDLFASNSLSDRERAAAAATHPDILTEITARAATKVAEQANDVFSVDPPNLGLVPTLLPTPLESAYTDNKRKHWQEQTVFCHISCESTSPNLMRSAGRLQLLPLANAPYPGEKSLSLSHTQAYILHKHTWENTHA